MLKLYAHLNRKSPNTLKLRVALAEAGAEYEYLPVDLGPAKEQQRPEFLALNPHGKIPVLVHDDFALPESDAILWYLAEAFPAAQLLPADAQGRARVLQWMDFASTALYPAYYDIYANTTGGTPERRNPAIAEAARPKLARALKVLEGELGKRPWIAGATFTAADIAVAAVLHTLRERIGFDSAAHQNTMRWWMRVAERPAWRRCVE